MNNNFFIRSLPKPIEEVSTSLQESINANGFSVLYVHNVQATLASKGIQIEPFKAIQ